MKVIKGCSAPKSFFVRLRNLSNVNSYAITLFSVSDTGDSKCDDGTTLVTIWGNVSTIYTWTVPTADFNFNQAFLVIDGVDTTVSTGTSLTTTTLLTALNALGVGTFATYTDGDNEIFYIVSETTVFGDLTTYGSDGTVWITNSDTVWNVNSLAGSVGSFLASAYGGSTPTGISVAKNGTLWISEDSTIYNVETNGTLISSFSVTSGASGVSEALDGTLWISNSVSVGVISNVETDGTLISSFLATDYGGKTPTGVSADYDGTLWITDPASSDSVINVGTDGTLISSFDITSPTGISAAADGTLWITRADRFINISKTGVLIKTYRVELEEPPEPGEWRGYDGASSQTGISVNENPTIGSYTPIVTTDTISGTEVEAGGSVPITELINSAIGNKYIIRSIDLDIRTGGTPQIEQQICITIKDLRRTTINFKELPVLDPNQKQHVIKNIIPKHPITLDGKNNITYKVLAGSDIRMRFHVTPELSPIVLLKKRNKAFVKYSKLDRSLPIIIKVVNSSASAISNISIGDSYTNRAASNFNQDSNITITSDIVGVSYIEFLAESERSPFEVGNTMIISASAGQPDDSIILSCRNTAGDRIDEKIKMIVSPNQGQSDRSIGYGTYYFDGFTKLVLRQINANATVIIRLYPASIFKDLRKDSDLSKREMPIMPKTMQANVPYFSWEDCCFASPIPSEKQLKGEKIKYFGIIK